LGELSYMAGQPALDQRWVLPREHQDLHAQAPACSVDCRPQGDEGARSGASASLGARPRSRASIGDVPPPFDRGACEVRGDIARKSFTPPLSTPIASSKARA